MKQDGKDEELIDFIANLKVDSFCSVILTLSLEVESSQNTSYTKTFLAFLIVLLLGISALLIYEYDHYKKQLRELKLRNNKLAESNDNYSNLLNYRDLKVKKYESEKMELNKQFRKNIIGSWTNYNLDQDKYHIFITFTSSCNVESTSTFNGNVHKYKGTYNIDQAGKLSLN
ncbi:MAG: hypothetical protein HQL32_13235, partial [Planctomycetes bacterium]|nr:hypothetical protein [Planctomycetota bacterium]